MYLLYFLCGFVLLYYGANFLVRGSSSIAVSLGVKKIVVGLTLVALGTSMPEFVVSLFAALRDVDDVSVGNIVGSNLANILLVLGMASIISPIRVKQRVFILELPILLVITLLFVIFCANGHLISAESLMLFIIFSIYMTFIVVNRRVREESDVELVKMERGHIIKNCLLAMVGLVGLAVGGELTVRGATGLARALGISEVVIGLTVVAIGTSLPELFTSIVAVLKKEEDISIGNIIGSNLFNIAFVLGIIPTIRPLAVAGRVIRFENPLMLGITILFAVFLFIGRKLSRFEGAMLLLIYLFFILNLILDIV